MNNKKVKVAINGFGRIGRALFKSVINQKTIPEIEFLAINDLGDLELLAYLLKYDSVYGRWDKKVETRLKSETEKYLIVEDKEIKFIQEKDPSKLPWKELNVDIVIESTGILESFEKSKAHIDAGAKRVIITAPAKDKETSWGKTVLPGINDEELKNCLISSNGSCTTQSASPVMQILSEKIGVKKAFLITTHGYTSTQNLIDGPTKGKDFRRARAAGVNIVPTSTGAAIAVARAVKNLIFDGIALRVPVINGSISVIVFISARPTTKEEINDILVRASQEPRWKGLLKVISEPIVSSDIINDPHGAIVDLNLTSVIDKDLCAVFSWYDNEAGYTQTLLEHLLRVARLF